MVMKIVGLSTTVTTSADQITDSRFQRVYNSNTTVVANVQIGSNSSNISYMVTLGPGDTIVIDLGEMRPEYGGLEEKWISLAGGSDIVYRTPISAG